MKIVSAKLVYLSLLSHFNFTGSVRRFRMNKSLLNPTFILLIAGTFFLFPSCTTTKHTIYFEDLPKDTVLNNMVSKDFEPKILKGDLLGITVGSLSPENTTLYNVPQNAIGEKQGYLVDETGNIPFVKLGNIQAEGLTRKELKASLETKLKPYLTDAIVSIGFLNRHITLMGAVSPKIVPLEQDNMTILDALASGGGVDERGKIDKILVIREKDSSKEFKRLDLTDQSIFYSPYFYVQPNDIIYVEPLKKKAENITRIISYVTAGLTLTIFILDRVLKKL